MVYEKSGPSVLDHLGPFTKHAPVQAFCLLSQKTWELYHQTIGGQQRNNSTQREYLAGRMMYISEVMSRGVRLNASWALTHAAMSLLRDRYEQTLRFSWLARQTDAKEIGKYWLHKYSKTRALLRNVPENTRQEYEKLMGPLPPWATEELSKEQQARMKEWETLDLRRMAKMRDALPKFTELPIGRENMEFWYDPIYAQFSSVSHFDMYSIEMIGLHKAPDGKLVMAANQQWPSLLVLQNCMFDILQCFESAHAYYDVRKPEIFEGLYQQWFRLTKGMELGPRSAR